MARHKHKHSPKLLFIFLSLGLLASLFMVDENMATSGQSDKTAIQYTVISQRWLTQEEISKFEDVKGYKIAIRVRLANDSPSDVEYLASSFDIRPLGYRWERKRGKKEWEFTPPSRGREGLPGSEFTGIGYTWRILPARSAVESEILSYTARDEEFAFSTFIRKGSENQMREIVSNVIHPLVDR